jgi:hypothetical protein
LLKKSVGVESNGRVIQLESEFSRIFEKKKNYGPLYYEDSSFCVKQTGFLFYYSRTVSFTVTRHVTRSEAKVIRVSSDQSSLAERARNSQSVSGDFNIDFSTEKSLID